MKNFTLGLSISLLFGILGIFLIINNLPKNNVEMAKDCTFTEVKLCYDGIANRCCPPKVMEIARKCTWSEIKACYSGASGPNNTCCPPKYQMIDEPQEITKNCTWGDVKMCYSGQPVTNSACCPPKYQMEIPV